jgi:hypothetical protein
MRHKRNDAEDLPLHYTKLLGAISRMLSARDQDERNKIFTENPILLSPKAIELIERVIADFEENVTIVDDFPLEWKRLRNFLGEKQEMKKLHETDCQT